MSEAAARPIFIFKVNQLGDAVAFLPTLQRLVASAKARAIPVHVWTTPLAGTVLNFDPYLHLHQTPLQEFNSAWKKPVQALQFLWEIKRTRPAACLLDWDQGNFAHLAAFLSGAPTIVSGRNAKVALKALPHEIVNQDSNQPMPYWSWEIGRQFARIFFEEDWEPAPPAPNFDHLICHSEPPTSPQPIVIHPGASAALRRWPLERYLILAGELAKTHPVLLIQPRELPPITPPAQVQIVFPNTISELVTLIAHSAMFIGNNSGPLHFAFALGVPSIAFWGSTDPAWRAAWQPEKHLSLLRKELPCLGCEMIYQDNQCHNLQEPIACMNRWQIGEVLPLCLDWLKKWHYSKQNTYEPI